MKTLLMCLCVVGCAYGSPLPEQHHGTTKGNTIDQPDSGIDNVSGWDDENNDSDDGCYTDYAIDNGVILYSFEVCPAPQQEWLTIPDPDPFKAQGKKQ